MIGILYSCAVCGLVDAEVRMPYRESEEDVVVWLRQKVMRAVQGDHLKRSPRCPADSVDLKIPAPPGTEWIGGPVQQ